MYAVGMKILDTFLIGSCGVCIINAHLPMCEISGKQVIFET